MLVLIALLGCSNACQHLCVDLANYAEDDCGASVSQDEVQACKDAYSSATIDDTTLDECVSRSDPDALREWWTCDDLKENFQNGWK